jgi:diguanylate cyclase (GGDEF)-like protein
MQQLPDSDQEQALDTLAALIRALPAGLRDDDDAELVRETFEKWAQHILLLTSSPGPGGVSGRRDWPGLRLAVVEHLRAEDDGAKRGIGDLRAVIGALTESFSRAVVEEAGSDAKAHAHIEQLRIAVKSERPEDLKRVALATVDHLGSIFAERDAHRRARAKSFSDRMRGLQSELLEARRDVQTDALTGLVNRRGLESELERAHEAAVLMAEPSQLFVVDIDHFKRVNDDYGHAAGDAVLRALAGALALAFPRKRDCVARFGGEEFVIIARDTDAAGADVLGRRLLDAVRRVSVAVREQVVFVSASVGVTDLDPREPVAASLERADRALYAAKSAGRDRLMRF